MLGGPYSVIIPNRGAASRTLSAFSFALYIFSVVIAAPCVAQDSPPEAGNCSLPCLLSLTWGRRIRPFRLFSGEQASVQDSEEAARSSLFRVPIRVVKKLSWSVSTVRAHPSHPKIYCPEESNERELGSTAGSNSVEVVRGRVRKPVVWHAVAVS